MALEISGTEAAAPAERVTAETLKKAFRCWHQGRAFPPELFDLQLLAGFTTRSRTAQSIYLYDYLFDLVVRQLCILRESTPLSFTGDAVVSRKSARAQIIRDFAFNNGHACPERMVWSALFFRYLSPVRFSSGELAQVVGFSERHLRRQVQLGLRYLARELYREEMAAHQ